MRTLKVFCFGNVCFRVRTDRTGQHLDIELDLVHAPLIINESGCNAITKTVTSPREKLQDKLVLNGRKSPILKREDATRYRSACMRLSHLAQRMSEPREFDFIPLKRAARCPVWIPAAALIFPTLAKSQSSWTAISLAILSRVKTRLDWWLKLASYCEIWIQTLRSIYTDPGIPMKVEIQSDSSTANSLTNRLGAGPRTKHIDTRYFWVRERIQDGDLSTAKVPTAKNSADVGTKPVSASVLQQHCKFAGMVFY